MNDMELYKMLEIPDEVEKRLLDYGNIRTADLPEPLINKILQRSQ